MRVLLDTHTFLWLLRDDPLLSRRAADLLDDPATEPLVSAVSAYEICFKQARGKLSIADQLCAAFERETAAADCSLIPLTVGEARVAAGLDTAHRDPFDRLLAAQALAQRVPIVSNDPAFDRFGVERIW